MGRKELKEGRKERKIRREKDEGEEATGTEGKG